MQVLGLVLVVEYWYLALESRDVVLDAGDVLVDDKYELRGVVVVGKTELLIEVLLITPVEALVVCGNVVVTSREGGSTNGFGVIGSDT